MSTLKVGDRVELYSGSPAEVRYLSVDGSLAYVDFGAGGMWYDVTWLRRVQGENQMPTSVTITAERILEAAKTCPDAEKVLRTLAPEVFKDVDLKGADLGDFMRVRDFGSLRRKSFYLDPAYTWSIETDDEDVQCLVPRRK